MASADPRYGFQYTAEEVLRSIYNLAKHFFACYDCRYVSFHPIVGIGTADDIICLHKSNIVLSVLNFREHFMRAYDDCTFDRCNIGEKNYDLMQVIYSLPFVIIVNWKC